VGLLDLGLVRGLRDAENLEVGLCAQAFVGFEDLLPAVLGGEGRDRRRLGAWRGRSRCGPRARTGLRGLGAWCGRRPKARRARSGCRRGGGGGGGGRGLGRAPPGPPLVWPWGGRMGGGPPAAPRTRSCRCRGG